MGEPRLPRAPQCGDFYCGAPALRTHAREGGPRAPSPAQGGAKTPRRLAVPCVTRAPQVSRAATHRPRPCALTPQRATPVSPLAAPAPPASRTRRKAAQ